MKRKLNPDELNQLEQMGYNTSSYKGELVEFPDAEPTSTALGAGGRAALANALPATAGAAGFAGGMALAAPFAPATGGLSFLVPIASGLISGALASGATKYAQDAILPQSVEDRLALDVAEHPVASRAGAIGANLLTMRPSLSVTRDAFKGLAQLPAASVAGSGAMQTLNPVYRNALANVGMGAGISGAVEGGRQLATGELNLGDLATETLVGAALNKPTPLGAKVMRLPAHSTGERPIDNPEALRNAQGTVQPPQNDAHIRTFRESLAAQRQFNDAAIGMAEESMANQAKLSAELQAVKQSQAETKAALDDAMGALLDRGYVDTARQQKLADYAKMQEIDRAEQARNAELELKTRDPLSKLEVTPEESAQDLEMRRIEASLSGEERPRYSTERAATPTEQTLSEEMAQQKIPTAPSKGFNQAVDDLLQRKNIGVEENRNIEDKGMMRPGSDERKIFVNPEKETVDTRAHEGLHYEIQEIEKDASTGNARAKSFIDSLYSKQSEILAEYNKKLAETGQPPVDAHEFATTEQGARFVQEQLNTKREGPWRKWWNDTKALWNQRFGKNPSVDDLQRALNYRFVNREGMGTVGKFGPLGETGTVRPMPTVGKSEEERKSKANPLEGYRKVNVVKADGSREEVYFNDKYYDMGEMGKFASIAKITPEGSLTHGALKKGETIEEIPSERKSEAGRGISRDDQSDWKKYTSVDSNRTLTSLDDGQSGNYWIAPNGDAIPVRGHAEFAEEFQNKPARRMMGDLYDGLYANGWHRVVIGKGDSVYVQAKDKPSNAVIRRLTDVAIANGKTHVIWDNQNGKSQYLYNAENQLEQRSSASGRGLEREDKRSFMTSSERVLRNIKGAQSSDQVLNTLRNKIPPAEWDILQKGGIESAFANRKVTADEVAKWVQENGPRAEGHSYGMEGKVSEAKKEYDRMTHEWYDRLSARQKDYVRQMQDEMLTDTDKANASKYRDLANKIADEPRDTSPRATDYYNKVSALPTNEPMPEWTASKSGKNVQRVDVVIPGNQKKWDAEIDDINLNLTQGEVDRRAGFNLWTPDGLHENLPNTIGWAMIQYKTGPNGEKIAVIPELQARWAQEKRKYWELYNDYVKKHQSEIQGKDEYAQSTAKAQMEARAHAEAAREVRQYRPGMDHTLADNPYRLILKAAIEQARKEGATHIAISDAETAMMTEGHDVGGLQTQTMSKQAAQALAEKLKQLTDGYHIGVNWADGENKAYVTVGREARDVVEKSGVKLQVSQEPGMRLNYDTILPKIAEELTGQKGERMSLGEHKNAYDTPIRMLETGYLTREAALRAAEYNGVDASQIEQLENGNWGVKGKARRSNLIFRNPDGTPKTDVTARIFALDKAKGIEEPFSYFEKRSSKEGVGLSRTPREEQQESPEFRKWFGNSKVVDKEGKPKVLYHGARENFNEYDKSKLQNGKFGIGAYLTDDPSVASRYGDMILPLYVKLEKPFKAKLDDYTSVEDFKQVLQQTWNRLESLLPKTLDKDMLKMRQQFVQQIINDPNNYRSKAGPNTTSSRALYHAFEFFDKNWPQLFGHDGMIIDVNPEHAYGATKEYLVYNPTQIKSATGNSGAFDSSNPDIRYSKANTGLSRTEGETADNSWKSFIPAMASTFDKVERVSKPHAEAARRYEARKDNYTGKGNVALQALERYGRNDVNRVMQQHREAYRNRTEPVLTGKDDKAISAILSNYYGSIADARRELGIRINNREAGKNEYYVPDMMNAETLDLFINHPQSPEALAAKEAWAEHVSNQSEGELTIDKVRQDINEYIEALKGQKNNYRSLEFGAIRRAAGYGLPESMRDTDAINTLARYSRRAAADLAFFQEIQSKPEIAGPLHIKNQYGEVYPGYKDSTLSQTDEIQNMMQWITGNVSGKLQKQPRVNAVVRLVNNSLLGPATGVRDLVSVPTHALPYISRLSDIKAVWDGLLDVRKNAVDSLAYAAKQPSIDRVQFNDVLDAPDRVSTVLNKAADLMRKAQGREALENFSRDVTFSIGKELGRNNILAAKAGDKKALSWLEKFGTLIDEDVTKLQGEELEKVLNQIGKNFTDRNQGTYGGRGLPLGVVDSSFAPFLSLQKWAIEKSNTIYKDVYKPFITGENRLPMLTYTLGSIMTGAAIQQLNELMSNRKPNDPTVKEALDKGDAASIATEMATLMQLGSYAGIVSDGLKMLTDTTIRGKTPRNIVSFPTASAAVRTEEAVTNMLEAIRQGENPWDVLKAFTLDMAVNNVQTARLVANRTWKDEDVERSDKFRDMRIFGELEGKPAKDFTPTNPYLGLKQKKFKRTGDIAEAARLAPELVKDAVSGAENSGELKSSLRGLKANSYQTFPSPEERPEEFLKYYNYLIRTQGKKNADERLMDYFRQRSVNKVKSEMIP